MPEEYKLFAIKDMAADPGGGGGGAPDHNPVPPLQNPDIGRALEETVGVLTAPNNVAASNRWNEDSSEATAAAASGGVAGGGALPPVTGRDHQRV